MHIILAIEDFFYTNCMIIITPFYKFICIIAVFIFVSRNVKDGTFSIDLNNQMPSLIDVSCG